MKINTHCGPIDTYCPERTMIIFQQTQSDFETERPAALGRAGFTLVELMISVFILAIIVTTLFGAYRAVFSNAGTLEQFRTDFEMARNCLDRIIIDLTGIHVMLPPQYRHSNSDANADPYAVVGDQVTEGRENFSRLKFASVSHVPSRRDFPQGVAEIVYQVKNDVRNGFVLKRSDRLFRDESLDSDRDDPALCFHVRGFKLTYYDHTGQEFDAWDSESDACKHATPSAVGIRLEIGDSENTQIYQTRVHLPVIREPLK